MNQFPFRKDPNPDLTRTIAEIVAPKGKKTPKGEPKAADPKGGKYEAKPVAESHTRAQLEKLSTTRLRELMKKYERMILRGDKDAARELADIRGILRSKGAGHALEEASACERAAAARLKAANAEDLEEKPGKAGEKAHKRLHTTIKSVVGEGQEYTAALEAALLALCEELDLAPDELFEMAQTYDRWRETKAKHDKLMADWMKPGSGSKARKALAAHERASSREEKSKTLYGKGGKAIRKDTPAHAAAKQKSKSDWAAHHARTREWHRTMSNHPDRAVRADYNAQMGGYRDADDQRRATRPTRREMDGPGLDGYD
jgi:hypothetical protein